MTVDGLLRHFWSILTLHWKCTMRLDGQRENWIKYYLCAVEILKVSGDTHKKVSLTGSLKECMNLLHIA